MTFSGTATDDGSIKVVYVALLNNSTGENLTTDGTWGIDNGLNLYKLPPGNITAPTRGRQELSVDVDDAAEPDPGQLLLRGGGAWTTRTSTTPQSEWAVMTMNAVVTGDAPPKATITPAGVQPPSQNLTLNLAGNATDDLGVSGVRLVLKDLDTGKYLQTDGTAKSGFASVPRPSTVDRPRTRPARRGPRTVTLPMQGNWNVTAYAVDTAGQRDLEHDRRDGALPDLPG